MIAFSESKWIGSPYRSINTWNLKEYNIHGTMILKEARVSFFFAARDYENGIVLEISDKGISLFELSDLAWEGHSLERKGNKKCCIKSVSYPITGTVSFHICVNSDALSLAVNDTCLIDRETILPLANPVTEPAKSRLMLIGAQTEEETEIREYTVTDGEGEVIFDLTRANACTVFERLGKKFYIRKELRLTDPVPTVMVGKRLHVTDVSLIKKAVLRATARGFYECYLNGQKVGNSYYAPGFTDYRLHIDYQEEDITDLIKQSGNNPFFSAIVTHGYYSGFCGYSGAEIYGRENSFLGEIEIEYHDGRVETMSTDESFLYTDLCPVVFADYLDGEYYDANNDGAFIGEGVWVPCGIKEAPGTPIPTNGNFEANRQPDFMLCRQDYEPAKVREEIGPTGVLCMPKGHYVYDFGQNLVGTVKVRINAPKGKTFRLRYGEMSYKDGEIYIQNIRTAANTDIYVSNGKEADFIPSMAAHGFRYVEITGVGFELDSTDEIMDIKALVINNLVRKTGGFECSDELINRLQKNIEWGQKGNYLLIPTDCPQRNERMGWTGDAQVFASTAAFNMDVLDFTKKWLRDLREATLMYNRENAIPDTAPLGGDNRPGPCGGWSDAAVIVPWELYEEYADKSIIIENYEMMKGWVDYQSRADRECESIQLEKRRGDHLAYDTSTSFELCATAYAARSADYLSKAAALLGKEEDAAKYRERFEMIKKAYIGKWIGPDGDLNVHSQTSYALTIDFDLCPSPISDNLKKGFVKAIHDYNDHLSVGFLGISHLLPALSKIGEDELAAELLFTKTEPGWLYSVLNGATTIWERWNSYIAETGTFGDVNMNSFNHYAYGSVGSWIYENILGIKRLSPGYKDYEICPKVLGGLTWARGYHDTPNGRITVSWKLDPDGKMYIEK